MVHFAPSTKKERKEELPLTSFRLKSGLTAYGGLTVARTIRNYRLVLP
jgi:hypothetical protein